jgi:hypothetical protein
MYEIGNCLGGVGVTCSAWLELSIFNWNVSMTYENHRFNRSNKPFTAPPERVTWGEQWTDYELQWSEMKEDDGTLERADDGILDSSSTTHWLESLNFFFAHTKNFNPSIFDNIPRSFRFVWFFRKKRKNFPHFHRARDTCSLEPKKHFQRFTSKL